MKNFPGVFLALAVAGGTLTACAGSETVETPATPPAAIQYESDALAFAPLCLQEVQTKFEQESRVPSWGSDPAWHSTHDTLVLAGNKDLLLYTPTEFVGIHYMCVVSDPGTPEQKIEVQVELA